MKTCYSFPPSFLFSFNRVYPVNTQDLSLYCAQTAWTTSLNFPRTHFLGKTDLRDQDEGNSKLQEDHDGVGGGFLFLFWELCYDGGFFEILLCVRCFLMLIVLWLLFLE